MNAIKTIGSEIQGKFLGSAHYVCISPEMLPEVDIVHSGFRVRIIHL